MPTKRDKVWQAEVSYKHHGTFKKWRKSGFKTKKEALIAESEFKLNIQKYLQKKYTLYEWFETWAEIYKKPSVSIRTYQKYINILVNIKKYFGDVRLDKIKNSGYQKVLNEFAKTHQKETVKTFNSRIRSSVQSAILDDIIKKDFTKGAILNGIDTKQQVFLNYSEFISFRNYTSKSTTTSTLALYLMIMTGLRFGEVAGLTWKDITTDKLSVNKSWNFYTNEIDTTKNKQSNRTIPIPIEVYKNILNLDKGQKYIFDNGTGKPITNNAAQKQLQAIMRKLEIDKPTIRPHSLRHTHASILLYNGVSLYAISKRLGHASILTTQETYAHMIEEMEVKEDDKILTTLIK